MDDRLLYAPSDCFQTFPFPPKWEDDDKLAVVGEAYHSHRAALMVKTNKGLTKTYNRFHDPADRAPDIERLGCCTRRWTPQCCAPTAGTIWPRRRSPAS